MGTTRLSKCFEQTRQLNAKAIQEYKDVSDYITYKMEEARTGCDCHRALDLAVGLERVLLECQFQMQQRIEKAAREVTENLPSELGKSEKLKARLNDIKAKIWSLLVASKSSTDKVPDWPRKEEPNDIVFEKFDAYWIEGNNLLEGSSGEGLFTNAARYQRFLAIPVVFAH
jgi:hypothetical protein